MNKETSQDLDTCVQEVLVEELRFQSQNSVVEELRAFSAYFSNKNALLSTKGKPLQCYECKEFVHVSRNYKKKTVCNY